MMHKEITSVAKLKQYQAEGPLCPIRYCQCKKSCTAIIRSPKSKVARGHYIIHKDAELRARISAGVLRAYDEGRLIKLTGDRSPTKKATTREKMKEAWVKRKDRDGLRTWRMGTPLKVRSKKLHTTLSCRSKLEKRFIHYLDCNKKIAAYGYEPLAIPYVHEGKTRDYFPDFVVYYKRAPWQIVEIKPDYVLKSNYRTNKAEYTKLAAGESFAREFGLRYLVVGESWLSRRGY